MSGDKVILADYLNDVIKKKYGSVLQAAETLGIPYEGLKKSVQRNTFNALTLEIFFPGRTLDGLHTEFSFEVARRYKKPRQGPPVATTMLYGVADRLSEEDRRFIAENPVVADRILALIVSECVRIRDSINKT